MDTKSLVRTLHPLEIKVLGAYVPGRELSAALLAADLGYKEGQANQAFSWRSAAGLAEEAGRTTRTVYELTPLGLEWITAGTPEERILRHLTDKGPARLPEICAALGLEQKDVGSAFGEPPQDKV